MEIHTDFLVLGTGIAGLSFAIKAAELGSVAMVTKKDKRQSHYPLLARFRYFEYSIIGEAGNINLCYFPNMVRDG